MTCDLQIEPVGAGAYDAVLTETAHGLDFVLVGDTAATHPAATLQRLTYAIGVWLGELVFDRSKGFPWVQAVFGGPIDGVSALLQERISRVEGVEGVPVAPDILYDAAARRIVIPPVKVTGEAFEVDFEQELQG
jgi:hypothetical protein